MVTRAIVARAVTVVIVIIIISMITITVPATPVCRPGRTHRIPQFQFPALLFQGVSDEQRPVFRTVCKSRYLNCAASFWGQAVFIKETGIP